MSEMSREQLLAVVREAYDAHDPVPGGLVARMQTAAALAADEHGVGFELELMTLLAREDELAGTRADAASRSVYTLRFTHDQVDLLLRIARDGDRSRIDGWLVPPEPMTVRLLSDDGRGQASVVSENGRFDLPDVPSGLVRLRLEPHDDRPPFATPSFEI